MSSPPTPAPTAVAAASHSPWQVPSGAWPEIWTTVQLDIALAAALLIAFAACGARARVYAPRRATRPRRAPSGVRDGPRGYADCAALGAEATRRAVGTDAYVLLRFLRLWRDACGAGGALALAVLVPVYATAKAHDTGFDALTIAAIKDAHARAWAPICFMYAFSALVARGLAREGAAYAALRTRFLAEGEADDGPQARCSVVVERVPPALRSDAALAAYFRRLFGAEAVHSAVVFVDCRGLEATLAARDAARARAAGAAGATVVCWRWDEDAAAAGGTAAGLWRVAGGAAYWRARERRLDAAAAASLRRREAPAAGAGAGDGDVETANPLTAGFDRAPRRAATAPGATPRLARLLADTADDLETVSPLVGAARAPAGPRALRRKTLSAATSATQQLSRVLAVEHIALSREFAASSTGVVTFASPGVAATAAQVEISGVGFSGVRAVPGGAADRDDVIYANVGGDAAGVAQRRWLADLLLAWLAVLATPLVGAIMALSNLREVARVVPALRGFAEEDEYAYARDLVTGYLPVVLVLGLLLLAPGFLEALATRYVRLKTRSQVQQYVLVRHFWVQLLTIFVTVLSGSLLNVIRDFLREPATLGALLGTSVPAMGAYFLQLLATEATVSTACEAAQPAALALDLLGRAPAPPEFKAGHAVPVVVQVVLVACVYAPIAPLLLVPAGLFFHGLGHALRRNLLLVYDQPFQSGGASLFPNLVFFSALSLVVAQLALFCYLGLGAIESGGEAAWIHAPWLLPLPLATRAHYRHVVSQFVAPFRHLNRDAATEWGLFADASAHLDAEYYRQPALRAAGAAAAKDPAEVTPRRPPPNARRASV